LRENTFQNQTLDVGCGLVPAQRLATVTSKERSYQNTPAHRFSYLTYIGPIPDGLQVLHKCDNPPCINPDHLFLGTHKDNMADMADKGRANGGAPKGERHGRTHLAKADVLAIRSDPRPGRVIAREYGMSKSAIYYIKSGETWRD
jgi:hypothetical protein